MKQRFNKNIFNNLINIQDVTNNVSMLSKTLPSLNIDSIFIEQDGKTTKKNNCMN